MKKKIKLGVNIDHIATLRNARNENFPDIITVSKILHKIKVDSITVHLREDRRHIRDKDVEDLRKLNLLPLNFEMAATNEMREICLKISPSACCIVPERREELTTDGGLDVKNQMNYLNDFLPNLIESGVKVSLFVDPDISQIQAAKDLGVYAVELHTGKYANLFPLGKSDNELQKIKEAALFCSKLGLECHAGHGLNYDNVKNISKIHQIVELNVGHFIISNSIYTGLEQTVKKFMQIIEHPSQRI